jgi:hypothetical protein
MPMTQPLDHSLALLARTPAVLDALLRDLPESWTLRNEGENTWSAFDIVGHLIHCEHTNWLPRTKWLLQHGETQPFPPFDRQGHVHECQGKSLSQLLDEFARLRAENLTELHAMNLQPDDLARLGLHPALGPLTLSDLLASWAAHDLNHLHQLSRVMATQYRETIGPFTKFMGVMHCNAHGA